MNNLNSSFNIIYIVEVLKCIYTSPVCTVFNIHIVRLAIALFQPLGHILHHNLHPHIC